LCNITGSFKHAVVETADNQDDSFSHLGIDFMYKDERCLYSIGTDR
jgi:hypothetical protein